ncbi:MAG: hypothetical protein M3Q14_01470 [bacterium]|nr:hypothetical protein [bacterium]
MVLGLNKAPKNGNKIPAQADLLFINLAEQVKTPFVQIAHAAELLQASPNRREIERIHQEITVTSKSALQLIDGYLLSVELQREATPMLESVSISAVLYDAANSLNEYANANGCKLELSVEGRYGPVMGHRKAMLAALISLGYSVIETCTKHKSKDVPKVRLAVSRTAKGFRTGIYMNKPITKSMLSQAKTLVGFSHQPFSALDSNNGSGIFIADSLFTRLHTPLRVTRNNGYYGFAATLIPSRQLSLV